ncbi:chemotaxis protein CheX [Anaerosporomusa subterranea]|uniref:Chemotaxis protein CheX n=1 Tax=Anaerosporomusa subterranea TaxID=1794912 RepID=A0A154BNH9_ANASB|nr:chemotaxis protein CheX [Anaerosporomusa subterranea]KYZ75486.1 chemotaxis protein CheX [Anaerosporomusa subterranea]
MDVKSIAPFFDAILNVMPQLGFQNVTRGRMSVADGNKIASNGVMVIVGLTHQLRGTIVYNMTEESAKKIASKMMMGMPVPDFDAMAESAISEMGNMLAANAAILFEAQGAKIDISPPTLIVGDSYTSTSGNMRRIIVEVLVDEIPLEVNISLNS